jgi:RNA recognition motif-containing protein
LFIGNLPYDTRPEDLREHFASVGELTQILIPSDPNTGRPRGFAFVDLSDPSAAQEAIRRFNGQPFKGRTIAVSEARPREQRPPGGGGGPRMPSGPPMSAPMAPPPPAPSRGRRTERVFGPDAKKGGFQKRGGGYKGERAPKGPIRERGGGRVFTIEDDSDSGPDIDEVMEPEPESEPEPDEGEQT